MSSSFRHALALAGVALLLTGACSDGGGTTTATEPGGPTSSSSAATTTVVRSSTTTALPPTTTPAGPVVAEAGGWRLAVTAPAALATVGSAFDLCYEVTGPAPEASIAFEITLVIAATGTVASKLQVDAGVGRGSARVNLGTPDSRRYDMPVQVIVNGQVVAGLVAVVRGVVFGTAPPPTGCA